MGLRGIHGDDDGGEERGGKGGDAGIEGTFVYVSCGPSPLQHSIRPMVRVRRLDILTGAGTPLDAIIA